MSADIVQARYTELEGVAGRFAGAGERVQEVARGVQGRADVLRRGGWEGRGQAAFLAELDAVVLPSLGRLAAALGDAQRVTAQMSATVRIAEEEAARLFGMAGGAAGIESGHDGVSNDNDSLTLLSSAGLFVGPALIKFLKFVRKHSMNRSAALASLHNLRRMLGHLGITISKSQMDNVYRTLMVKGLPHHGSIAKLLSSSSFTGFLIGADSTFKAINDWQEGKYDGDLLKIGGVNLLNGGMQYAITFIPHGTVVLAINSANQILGKVEVGAMHLYADVAAANPTMHQLLENDAVDMDAAYKKMNLTNITKDLSEGIWDGYSELLTPHRNMAGAYWNAYNELQRDPSLATMGRVTSNLAQVGRDNLPGLLTSTLALSTPATGWMFTQAGSRGAVDVLKATGNVVDGLADSVVIRSTSGYTRWTNSLVRDVNYLPISDGMKRQINGAAQDAASRVQTGRTWLTGLVDMKTGDDE